jgi:hypothetical protein
MRVSLENQEYFELKLNPKKDGVRISVKTKIDEESYAMVSCELPPEKIDDLITELIKFKSEVKNVKV